MSTIWLRLAAIMSTDLVSYAPYSLFCFCLRFSITYYLDIA